MTGSFFSHQCFQFGDEKFKAKLGNTKDMHFYARLIPEYGNVWTKNSEINSENASLCKKSLSRYTHLISDVAWSYLDDYHCWIAKKEVVAKEKFKEPKLTSSSNTSITQYGYEAIIKVVSCDYHRNWNYYPRILVDSPVWSTKVELVFDMSCNGRNKHLEKGWLE